MEVRFMQQSLGAPFFEWLVQLRRHFHQFPELAYQEEKTAAIIIERLREMGVPYRAGVGRTGVVASLTSKRPGPTVALRADMDALPLQELNDVEYRSKHPGRMHACGHDGHMAMALGVVRLLLENGWVETGCGKVLFLFQPAEEGGAGAREMLETGILDSEQVTAVFAGHMHPELPAGHIGVAPDVSNAASDSIHIRLKGKGGHGAHPHLCIDPIVAGAQLVTQIQSVVSRSVSAFDSAVITIGRFHAGTASNIIPQEALLDGTLRTLRPAVRDLAVRRLNELVAGLETAFGVSAELRIGEGYPLLVNDAEIVRFILKHAEEVVGHSNCHIESPRMGAEDFAYFLQKWPGALIRIGCHDPEKGYEYGLHSPHFHMDERALDVGVRLFTHLLTTFGRCVEGAVG
jgi:amidohydrolase